MRKREGKVKLRIEMKITETETRLVVRSKAVVLVQTERALMTTWNVLRKGITGEGSAEAVWGGGTAC